MVVKGYYLAECFVFNLMLYTYIRHLSYTSLFTYVLCYFFIFDRSISFQSL